MRKVHNLPITSSLRCAPHVFNQYPTPFASNLLNVPFQLPHAMPPRNFRRILSDEGAGLFVSDSPLLWQSEVESVDTLFRKLPTTEMHYLFNDCPIEALNAMGAGNSDFFLGTEHLYSPSSGRRIAVINNSLRRQLVLDNDSRQAWNIMRSKAEFLATSCTSMLGTVYTVIGPVILRSIGVCQAQLLHCDADPVHAGNDYPPTLSAVVFLSDPASIIMYSGGHQVISAHLTSRLRRHESLSRTWMRGFGTSISFPGTSSF